MEIPKRFLFQVELQLMKTQTSSRTEPAPEQELWPEIGQLQVLTHLASSAPGHPVNFLSTGICPGLGWAGLGGPQPYLTQSSSSIWLRDNIRNQLISQLRHCLFPSLLVRIQTSVSSPFTDLKNTTGLRSWLADDFLRLRAQCLNKGPRRRAFLPWACLDFF